jgi:hypothetical protein
VRRPLGRIRDESGVRVEVRVDRAVVAETTRRRLWLKLDPNSLSPGPHRLAIDARDAAGNNGRTRATFRVCNH